MNASPNTKPERYSNNVIREKSYAFAVRSVRLFRHLSSEKKENVLSRQILRSGTSIGANVEEAIGGLSKKEFAAKMSIAYKEARETSYWLRLLRDTDYLDERSFESIHEDCQELLRILYSIVTTSKTSSTPDSTTH